MAVTAGPGEAPSPVDINTAVIVDIHQDQQGGRLTDCSRMGAELVCKRIFGTA
ncbi:aspergillopepsin-2 [Magnaporthiopsis poae ATCC 64411]|uniref:Aspergillopepsin-2 n=1 Tax=Magnaporthiopsis poae (strain ATCC 64411 / 73-15) TaxID=644358 RepID=A0A0C4ECN9_MAGP6|nr:aspergillopepsin-2 [Magnaporthiopsis poae ATCC 64411]